MRQHTIAAVPEAVDGAFCLFGPNVAMMTGRVLSLDDLILPAVLRVPSDDKHIMVFVCRFVYIVNSGFYLLIVLFY